MPVISNCGSGANINVGCCEDTQAQNTPCTPDSPNDGGTPSNGQGGDDPIGDPPTTQGGVTAPVYLPTILADSQTDLQKCRQVALVVDVSYTAMRYWLESLTIFNSAVIDAGQYITSFSVGASIAQIVNNSYVLTTVGQSILSQARRLVIGSIAGSIVSRGLLLTGASTTALATVSTSQIIPLIPDEIVVAGGGTLATAGLAALGTVVTWVWTDYMISNLQEYSNESLEGALDWVRDNFDDIVCAMLSSFDGSGALAKIQTLMESSNLNTEQKQVVSVYMQETILDFAYFDLGTSFDEALATLGYTCPCDGSSTEQPHPSMPLTGCGTSQNEVMDFSSSDGGWVQDSSITPQPFTEWSANVQERMAERNVAVNGQTYLYLSSGGWTSFATQAAQVGFNPESRFGVISTESYSINISNSLCIRFQGDATNVSVNMIVKLNGVDFEPLGQSLVYTRGSYTDGPTSVSLNIQDDPNYSTKWVITDGMTEPVTVSVQIDARGTTPPASGRVALYGVSVNTLSQSQRDSRTVSLPPQPAPTDGIFNWDATNLSSVDYDPSTNDVNYWIDSWGTAEIMLPRDGYAPPSLVDTAEGKAIEANVNGSGSTMGYKTTSPVPANLKTVTKFSIPDSSCTGCIVASYGTTGQSYQPEDVGTGMTIMLDLDQKISVTWISSGSLLVQVTTSNQWIEGSMNTLETLWDGTSNSNPKVILNGIETVGSAPAGTLPSSYQGVWLQGDGGVIDTPTGMKTQVMRAWEDV